MRLAASGDGGGGGGSGGGDGGDGANIHVQSISGTINSPNSSRYAITSTLFSILA